MAIKMKSKTHNEPSVRNLGSQKSDRNKTWQVLLMFDISSEVTGSLS